MLETGTNELYDRRIVKSFESVHTAPPRPTRLITPGVAAALLRLRRRRHPVAPVRRFTFYCDGFFWLGCTAYSANRWLVRPHVSSAFVRGHLNDVWLIPCALPLVSWLHERCGWRTDEGPPRLAEIAAHVAGWSVLFEWIGPKYLPWTTADAWDVVWYAVGATLGWVWWQRTSRAGRKPMGFDAIVSHFFLDCFTAEELAAIVRRVADWSAPGALWVVSDFRVPDRGWRRRRAQAIHALMYTALRYVTRISARAVSPPDASLARAGFALISRHVSNQGLLHADLWRLAPANGCGSTLLR